MKEHKITYKISHDYLKFLLSKDGGNLKDMRAVVNYLNSTAGLIGRIVHLEIED